ncbi:unnamed protein product [Amoebophrya sp. A25]|nr:unnamed protein product [Amoebophrya sp. A25]|eukprot:GSA25T00009636001.1
MMLEQQRVSFAREEASRGGLPTGASPLFAAAKALIHHNGEEHENVRDHPSTRGADHQSGASSTSTSGVDQVDGAVRGGLQAVVEDHGGIVGRLANRAGLDPAFGEKFVGAIPILGPSLDASDPEKAMLEKVGFLPPPPPPAPLATARTSTCSSTINTPAGRLVSLSSESCFPSTRIGGGLVCSSSAAGRHRNILRAQRVHRASTVTCAHCDHKTSVHAACWERMRLTEGGGDAQTRPVRNPLYATSFSGDSLTKAHCPICRTPGGLSGYSQRSWNALVRVLFQKLRLAMPDDMRETVGFLPSTWLPKNTAAGPIRLTRSKVERLRLALLASPACAPHIEQAAAKAPAAGHVWETQEAHDEYVKSEVLPSKAKAATARKAIWMARPGLRREQPPTDQEQLRLPHSDPWSPRLPPQPPLAAENEEGAAEEAAYNEGVRGIDQVTFVQESTAAAYEGGGRGVDGAQDGRVYSGDEVDEEEEVDSRISSSESDSSPEEEQEGPLSDEVDWEEEDPDFARILAHYRRDIAQDQAAQREGQEETEFSQVDVDADGVFFTPHFDEETGIAYYTNEEAERIEAWARQNGGYDYPPSLGDGAGVDSAGEDGADEDSADQEDGGGVDEDSEEDEDSQRSEEDEDSQRWSSGRARWSSDFAPGGDTDRILTLLNEHAKPKTSCFNAAGASVDSSNMLNPLERLDNPDSVTYFLVGVRDVDEGEAAGSFFLPAVPQAYQEEFEKFGLYDLLGAAGSPPTARFWQLGQWTDSTTSKNTSSSEDAGAAARATQEWVPWHGSTTCVQDIAAHQLRELCLQSSAASSSSTSRSECW